MNDTFTFAVVPKETVNPFYDQVLRGCMDYAAGSEGRVTCRYVGPMHVSATEQAVIVRTLIRDKSVDGISLAVIEENLAAELARESLAAGIPFITFDSDAPNSERLLYVGTDNFAFGQSLGKVLLQLNPTGGKYGIITAAPPNIALRMEGLRDRLRDTKWTESADSPKDCQDSVALSLEQMWEYSTLVNAIIPVGGWPMRDPVPWKHFVDTNRALTLVVGDTDPEQLQLLSETYVDGLVGQVPYQMGSVSMQKLLAIKTGVETIPIFTTSLVEVVRIPLSLPPVNVNENHLGQLKQCGFVLCGVAVLSAIGFAVWTWFSRHRRVIIASQPMFLLMICLGVMIMALAIIPLSFDDASPQFTPELGRFACMSIPWFMSIGFTMIFATLFSKTWRINMIFRNKEHFTRVTVTARDVIAPFLALLVANAAVLSVWTVLAPMEYVRKPHLGTDDWNRILSTYGTCASRTASSVPYMVILGIINLGVMVISNVQAYQARSIQSEFSESHYIGVVMASMLQTSLIGIPILVLVVDNPRAYYLVVVSMIFLLCMSILLFLFVPKCLFVRKYSQQREEHERLEMRRIRQCLPEVHFFEERPNLTYQSKSMNACGFGKMHQFSGLGHHSFHHTLRDPLSNAVKDADAATDEETKQRGSSNNSLFVLDDELVGELEVIYSDVPLSESDNPAT